MPKITLKRVTNADGTVSELYPTTTIDQIFTIDGTGDPTTTTLDSHLTSTYVPLSQKGAANGVASLDGDSKVPIAQLPDQVFSGLTFVGTITTSSTPPAGLDVAHLIDGGANAAYSFTTLDSFTSKSYTSGDYAGIGDRYIGHYWVSNSSLGAVTLIDNSSTDEAEWGSAVFDDGVAPSGTSPSANALVLESGDWIIITGWDEANDRFKISIVNNTTNSASANTQGIVQLSSINTLTGASGNNVVTDGVLAGLVGTNAGDLAAGDHLHDGRYYQESEIDDFFSGSVAITGYNNDNWDAAYNDKVNSVGFATSTGVLTLTQQDLGTLTVDLDGRYAEEVTAGGGITVTQTGNSYEVAHTDTSSQQSVNFTGGTVIQDLTLDTYGHITSLQGYDLDGRYYTESEFNNWLDGTAIDSHYFTEIKYGANLASNLPASGNIVGTLLIETD